ncbi:hypothetical protein ACXC9Q_21450 [Kribbella sp. CWNU-51]
MPDPVGAEPSAGDRSPLDQAAADGSITQARIRSVDPVPIVTEPAGATLEPVLETNDPDVGVNQRVDPEVQAVDGTTAARAPFAGARRRLSPRPVPVSRRRRPPAATTGPATDEDPTPAEEMDDVGTHDEKATAAEADKAADTGTPTPAAEASGAGATATATRTARPKTAAEIVAEQRAREKAAAETPAGSPAMGTGAAGSEAAAPEAGKAASSDPAATSVTKPVGKVPTGAVASSNRPAGPKGSAGSGKGKQALTSVGSGVRKLRNLIASLIWLAAVLAAAVLALGALFTALDQTNQSNEIVRWILERGHDLVGPFKDLFRLETAKNTLLVNWGIAALVYLIAGKIIERFVRP